MNLNNKEVDLKSKSSWLWCVCGSGCESGISGCEWVLVWCEDGVEVDDESCRRLKELYWCVGR